MGIVNKRNAVVGWVTLKVGKRVVKQKAAGAVPSGEDRRRRRRRTRRARRRALLLAPQARQQHDTE